MNNAFKLKHVNDNEEFSLSSDELLVGRDDSCDIVIRKSHPSRRHAKLINKDGRWLLEDMNSTNGTFVNNRRIQKVTELNPGDVIKFGTEAYYFLAEDKADQTILASRLPSHSSSGSSVVSEEEPDSDLTSIEQSFPLPAGWSSYDDAQSKYSKASVAQLLKSTFGDKLDATEVALLFYIDDRRPLVFGVSAQGAAKKWSIGRNNDCRVKIDATTISGHHADLVHRDGRWKIVDAQSTNGLRNNGVLQKEIPLSDGSLVTLGQVEMLFSKVK